MKAVYTHLIICIFINLPLGAQPPDTLWTRVYGGSGDDGGYSVQQTSDGGYIVAGWTASFGAGNFDVWLLKLDVNGDTAWTKTYGGPAGDGANSIQQANDGGYIITGSTESFGAGDYDVYIIKTDSEGDSIWSRTYGGTNFDAGYSTQQTSDGGYIIAGQTSSFGAGYEDIYLIKTDDNGDTLWTKIYGGPLWDWGTSVQETNDKGYIVTGMTGSFGAEYDDVYLLKTDSLGNWLWLKLYGGGDNDFGWFLNATTDSGYIIAGFSTSFSGGIEDVYLIKTDANGDTIWTETYGGPQNDYGNSVQQTLDNGYIVAGSTRSFGSGQEDIYLLKIDENGDTVWTETYGGAYDEVAYNAIQTSDRGYIVTGYTESYGAGISDVYIIKTKSDIGIQEEKFSIIKKHPILPTILSGELPTLDGKKYRIFDVFGRKWGAEAIKPGIYFIDIEGYDIQKIIKIR